MTLAWSRGCHLCGCLYTVLRPCGTQYIEGEDHFQLLPRKRIKAVFIKESKLFSKEPMELGRWCSQENGVEKAQGPEAVVAT